MSPEQVNTGVSQMISRLPAVADSPPFWPTVMVEDVASGGSGGRALAASERMRAFTSSAEMTMPGLT